MKSMNKYGRQLGQGMTEYIIIVALIAIASIGVYQAFGSIVRGQTATAAATLGGDTVGTRATVTTAISKADTEGKAVKTLKDFEK